MKILIIRPQVKKILLLITLLCAMVQGAWAQNEWATVYTQTQTTSANWTALSAGSSTGKTLGTAGNTTYYYVTGNISFTNSNVGGSGLTIRGSVYLYVPSGTTLICTGANGSGQTGGGAGIELAAGNTLYLLGGGTVNATGGRAANGGNGGRGYDAECTYDESILGGSGGTGGNGGGGAGAGIGTRGATGGSGGSGGQRNGSYGQETTQYGVDGSAGSAGGTAAAMGSIYVFQSSVTLNATAGSAGSNGTGGSRGKTASQHPGSNVYMASGGGGGGAGGFGGAASNIGTGGPGGGGGGGGAAGNVAWVLYSGTANGYYHAGAYGGKGGQNANGSYAPDGADVELDNPKHADIQGGGLRDKDTDYDDDDGWEKGNNRHAGGSGAACGNASTSGSTGTVTIDWTTQENDWGMIFAQTGSTRADWTHLADGSTTGKTLGAEGTTTYYYTAYDRTFSNSSAGGSGLTIKGTVYLYVPSGKTITCTGANASGATGGGAGIELTAGNTLYIIGSGKLVATGGNAANGGNGAGGGDAANEPLRSGYGGDGGNGGGGAGAGIGTRGANGGAGGTGGASKEGNKTTGNAGSNGQNGGTAAEMGTLYIYDGFQALTPQTTIQGGSQGTSGGSGGTGGRHALYLDVDDDDDGTQGGVYHLYYTTWTMGGGGGGAGGGFGGAASNIGTGGPGGGGGGGGASGSIQYIETVESASDYYAVGAFGGSPGVNADGTTAGSGANTEMNSTANLSQINDKKTNFSCAGWQNGDNRTTGGSGGGSGSASVSGTANTVTVVWPTHDLADGSDNTTFITDHDGDIYDITLQGRTLYKDGSWNTLCLPFDLGNLSGTPLENATLMTLSSSNYDNGTLTLNFESATTIAAGKPYIVKWTTTGENISSPVFNGVTISSTPADVVTTAVTFKGNYDYLGFTEENRSILFLGTQNKLYYPLSGASIGACRAYFQLNGGITAGDPASAAPVRTFVLNFGGEATGIQGLTPDPSSKGEGSEYWYSLDGRRLSQKPSRAGVYINNGKMVVIK